MLANLHMLCVSQLTARHERNQETARREERLLMSAMYEVGVRLMDRKIQEQVLEPTTASTPARGAEGGALLGTHRAQQLASPLAPGAAQAATR